MKIAFFFVFLLSMMTSLLPLLGGISKFGTSPYMVLILSFASPLTTTISGILLIQKFEWSRLTKVLIIFSIGLSILMAMLMFCIFGLLIFGNRGGI